ncbi:LysR family transcriptional regulator ArgP [Gordonia rhizosphera]|uniref:Putative LysR family transcriptional regulator n=1 Tax=Gordonia rhizosphera NBRC 16068 TaxID=1108045 RepID=K6WFG9_9ACTN|nr:LysR family transcriptional regulator ArgP [Gordonia rhizosphera]GAB92511.1 putative LysR family transcriptional regulator [Gordonia rhizosphera NBRC 16068]
MEISQEGLQTLAAVLREGTFDAAAAALHITPSAVSQRIKALESSVGRVVLRRTKPATATPDGEVLVRLAKQWELLASEARSELLGGQTAQDTESRIRVPIAANADSLATWFLPVLARMHAEHPVAIEILRDDESQNGRFLRSGEVLGAITSDPLGIRGCAILPLGAMRYIPVATPAFVERWLPDGPTTEALSRAPMVQFDRNDYLQHDVLAAIAEQPVSPPISYIPASTEFHRAVELGIGWGAVPQVQIADALRSGRVVRIVGHHVDVPLFWQYWKLSSPILDTLTELTVAAAAEHLTPAGSRVR